MSVVLNFKSHLAELFTQALREVAPEYANNGVTQIEIRIERHKLAAHGDYACNLAMQLAKPLSKSPSKKEKREPKPPFWIECEHGLHVEFFSATRHKTQQA